MNLDMCLVLDLRNIVSPLFEDPGIPTVGDYHCSRSFRAQTLHMSDK